jgi:hypothetical protein
MEEAFCTGEAIICRYGKKYDLVSHIEKAKKTARLLLPAQIRSYLNCMSTQWIDEVLLADECTNLYYDAVF